MGLGLYHAVIRNHREIAQLLLARGADANAPNYEGKTPLQAALDKNRAEIADLLRQRGGHANRGCPRP
jgi:ankyrin repeat protein